MMITLKPLASKVVLHALDLDNKNYSYRNSKKKIKKRIEVKDENRTCDSLETTDVKLTSGCG